MRRTVVSDRADKPRSAGEIEAAVGRAVVGFLHETYGRGARGIRVHLHVDSVFVTLEGVMPESQQRLVADDVGMECASLLRQYRARILTVSRERICEAIREATGFRPRVVLHDFLPESGEEMLVFHLEGIPAVRG